MDSKLWTASRGECSKVFRTGCPLYARIFCNISGAPLVDAELPSALSQIKAPLTPITDCVKPAPYHRHWDFLIMYVTQGWNLFRFFRNSGFFSSPLSSPAIAVFQATFSRPKTPAFFFRPKLAGIFFRLEYAEILFRSYITGIFFRPEFAGIFFDRK